MTKFRTFEGILCEGISKTYKKYPFGIKSKNDFKALKSVYLRVEKGEILSISGPNGAGKTTLINILTGHMNPTQGVAKLFGFDLIQDAQEIKQISSLCPFRLQY